MRRGPAGAYPRSVTFEPVPDVTGPLGRVRRWLDDRRGPVDLVIAGGLWLLTSAAYLVSFAGLDVGGGELMAMFAVATLQTLPLAWRRTRPELSFVLVLTGHLAQLLAVDSPMPSNIAALVSAHAVANHSTRLRVRQLGLAAALLGGLLAVLDWEGYRDSSLSGRIMLVVFFSGTAFVCWLAGDLARKRRELVARLREQNQALRRDRDQRARIAAQDERTRIAREMHDIVAHSLSVVVVQADGASYAASHSPDFDREQARETLTTIGTTAREALAETRRLVGVLRTADDDVDAAAGGYRPTETLADLPALVERVASSGIDVHLDDAVEPTMVPRETALAAYRIVQESLTNVIKHAGPRAAVRVTLGADESLHVEVRDDGRGAAAPDDGHGHGLIGMRERAASVGGTMQAGPMAGGGYIVTAVLPFASEETR